MSSSNYTNMIKKNRSNWGIASKVRLAYSWSKKKSFLHGTSWPQILRMKERKWMIKRKANIGRYSSCFPLWAYNLFSLPEWFKLLLGKLWSRVQHFWGQSTLHPLNVPSPKQKMIKNVNKSTIDLQKCHSTKRIVDKARLVFLFGQW